MAVAGGQKKHKQDEPADDTGDDEYDLDDAFEDAAPAIARTEQAPKQKPGKKAPAKKAPAKKTANKAKQSKAPKQPLQAAAGKKGQTGKPRTQTRAQQKAAAAEKNIAAVKPPPKAAESEDTDEEPSMHIPAPKLKQKKLCS